ncbi:MAG: hypothetical protein WC889_02700 [Myxococcota bacterium]|jgi:hypothetical protein
MKGYIYEIEESTLRQLNSAKEGAEAMAQLFAEEGLSIERDNWKAVQGLLEQAVQRFQK